MSVDNYNNNMPNINNHKHNLNHKSRNNHNLVKRIIIINWQSLQKGEVERNLGTEFDELNPVHIAALTDSVANIKAQIYEQQSIQKNLLM